MFGIRTPVKTVTSGTGSQKSPGNKTPTEGAGPLADSDRTAVRRSIGEIEARITQPRPAKPTIAAKETKSSSSGAEAEKSPKIPPKYKNRTTEAKACLMKAKLQMEKSRNLKSDIKADVLEAIERLYVLVKEAELAKTAKEPPSVTTPIAPVPPAANSDQNTLATQIKEHTKLLQESNRKMEELKLSLEKQREQTEKATYANVTANHNTEPPPNRRETLHSVVVTSTDDTETGDAVLNRVREAVDAKEGWITVQRIRKAKDRKIIMGLKTKEERNKIKERLEKTGNGLIVEEVKNKDPLLILRDVLLINTDEDVLRAIRNQNRAIFRGLDDEEDRLEIKYRRKARNPHTGHIIVGASPTIWKRAVEAGGLHVDLQYVRVADQSPLVQCSRCLAYGHGRRFCQEPADICSHCGGPHLKAQCAEWLANGVPTCRNCAKAKLDKTEHNAFSSECPVRRRWDTLARTTVAYC